MFLNEHEIDDCLERFDDETPNLQRAAFALGALRDWTNRNSDGWCYWPKPCRAAARLQEILAKTDRYRHGYDAEDIDAAELRKALTPIRAFLTRQGVAHSQVIPA